MASRIRGDYGDQDDGTVAVLMCNVTPARLHAPIQRLQCHDGHNRRQQAAVLRWG
ncbi:hypothetical protein DOTSEDRAFT_85972 [Dothistroma septosporum NZE10]|uniref:Uncharacterized protein n=1 Tax=Dothistroma septosporum (strain NZE10 / CBS 128990) TaxID=675120 RepID=N1PZ24_DOTSN|nr:hypothetical protein DOTSEDRAFT_85972 [Dothistroma septosporum NZE10]